ncbi:CRISPR-associated RAMP protein, Cmr6 family [Thermocrinis albus DSM 14484]|uniref:CRISPR-associated RAMP protein, Cmr6 family n=1 Tax=Thermocrinis albus (strain DSM 14484 / JCM 11386 / HI 11/12) TaxID=638303 RepID=D3SNB2_THEAH|nr:type III-B CRISPR module RAMP protein Cmr6 [Thermocrinis albus]ADC88649.1 CRISPR-associated RAMP protein, Cmr6 family [Thermocrinis albus DSM 14484]
MKVEDTVKLIADDKTKFSNIALAFYKLNIFKLDIFKYLEKDISEIRKKEYLKLFKDSLNWDEITFIQEKITDLYKSIEKTHYVKYIKAYVGYRFVSGMGYPSPIENGFLLHHTYGIPYISGESVKGLVRYMYIYKNFTEENFSKERLKGLEEGKYQESELNEKEKIFVKLFGTQKEEGKIVFFDAYPESLTERNLSIDVMNNHYGEYYETKGEKEPGDWYNPNPVFFLTLEKVTFIFRIGIEKDVEEAEKLLDQTLELLKEGLELFGLGAKRRKGYGWFRVQEA